MSFDKEIPKKIYRGYGREKKEAAYNYMPEPILGKGKYYAFDKKIAQKYGPKIEETEIDLKNPLIIRSDVQWRDLTKKARWEYSNPFGQPKEKIKSDIKNLGSLLSKEGHDGVIVFWDETGREGYDVDRYNNPIRTLKKVFGEPQVWIS